MKKSRRILATLLALLMTLSCIVVVSVVPAVAYTINANESVYNASAAKTLPTPVDNVYTITTANEFMAFADTLNGGNNFSGKTIKLACDIVINPGAYGTWGGSPIAWSGNGGSWTNRFAGSFDGQGHTISGLYNVNNNNAGFFGRVVGGTEFKNVKIINSYFKSTAGTDGSGIGGLIGSIDGGSGTTTISNVQIEATIETTAGCPGVGGIVGTTANYSSNSLVIENCTFKGTINASSSSHVGGILGYMKYGKTLVLENCAASGTISGGKNTGGLVGHLLSCHAMISNCLAKGAVNGNATTSSGKYRTGLIIGFTNVQDKNMTVQMSNVLAAASSNHPEAVITTIGARKENDDGGNSATYTVTFDLENLIYDSTLYNISGNGKIRQDNIATPNVIVNGAGPVQSNNWYVESKLANAGISSDFKLTAKTSTELKGKKTFDFWNVVPSDYPTPPKTSVPDFYNGTARSTYITDGTTITIYTAEQLMGFANATSSSNFNGYTVKLARDFIINRGKASDWASSAPSYNWACSNSWGNRFAGIFDGQGHTIAGVYSSQYAHAGLFQCVAAGCTIQNLNIANSYFASTRTDDGGRWVGGLIGYIDTAVAGSTTTISNISVNAIVKGTARAGGLIGSDSGNIRSTTTNITNCTFNGEVSCSNGYVGGLIGYVRSYKNFTGCSVKGSVSTSGSYVGGLIGYACDDSGSATATVSIANCAVDVSLSGTQQIGGLIGRADRVVSVTVSNCLAKSDITASSNDNTIGGLIGYYSTTSGVAGSASISDTLISVKGNAANKVYSYSLTHYGNATLTLTFTNVKLDSTRYNGRANNSYSTAAEYRAETGSVTLVAAENLKGQSVFTGWTAVSGDYPQPAAKQIDTIKESRYANYGDPVQIIGYQIKPNGNGTYSIRLIGVFSNELASNYAAAGFSEVTVTLENGASKYLSPFYCQRVYKSIQGGGQTYVASDYLAEGFFCLVIESAPADVASIVATPLVKTSSAASPQYGTQVSWTKPS